MERVKNGKELHRFKMERNVLYTIERRKGHGLVTSCVRTVL
jgi:hypothetical protein